MKYGIEVIEEQEGLSKMFKPHVVGQWSADSFDEMEEKVDALRVLGFFERGEVRVERLENHWTDWVDEAPRTGVPSAEEQFCPIEDLIGNIDIGALAEATGIDSGRIVDYYCGEPMNMYDEQAIRECAHRHHWLKENFSGSVAVISDKTRIPYSRMWDMFMGERIPNEDEFKRLKQVL